MDQTQFTELRNKVEKLINLHERLHAENMQLKNQKDQLTKLLENKDQQITELEEKNKVIKLAQRLSGPDQNSRDLKLKINEYIREIDRCMALINR